MKRSVRLLAGLWFVLSCAIGIAAQAQQAAKPTLWAMPPNVNGGAPLRELFESPAAWRQARSRIVGIGYADHAFAEFSDAELRRWFAQAKLWNLKIAMEVGAVKPWGTTGDVAFAKSRPNWNRFLADGAEIDTIALDEPLTTTIGTLHQPIAYAVEQTANYIALVRKTYPAWKIGDIEPYPYIHTPQLLTFIDALQARLKQMNVRGLDFVRLDVDWMNFVPGNVNGRDGWRGVKSLELEIRRRGLPFSLIYWGANIPAATAKGQLTPMIWETAILGQGAAYEAVGGRPDEYVIEDWVKWPLHSVPEDAPGTFMHSVDAFGSRFLPR